MEEKKENTATEKEAEEGKYPKPPEEDFYGGNVKAGTSLREFLKKRSIRFILAALAFLIAVFSFVNLRAGKNRHVSEVSENKPTTHPLYTPAEMDEAISSSGKARMKRSTVKVEKNTPNERKLRTGITVFTGKNEDESPIRNRKQRRNEPLLGLPAGTIIPAFLRQNVLSFNVITPVIAEVSTDVVRDGKVLIPKGSRFIGEAEVIKTLDRINVTFRKLIFEHGSVVFKKNEELRIMAIAQSPGGPGGIDGIVDKHTDKRVLKAIGKSLVAGASLFVGGKAQDPYALEDQLRFNLAQNLTDEAARDLRSVKIEKSITVKAFEPIEVLLLEAL